MYFICTLSGLNVKRERYFLENCFDAPCSFTYTVHVHVSASIIHRENSNQSATNFSFSKKFLVISRVDLKEREREIIVTLTALTEFSGGNMYGHNCRVGEDKLEISGLVSSLSLMCCKQDSTL